MAKTQKKSTTSPSKTVKRYSKSVVDACVKSKHCKKEFEKNKKLALGFIDGMISNLKKTVVKQQKTKQGEVMRETMKKGLEKIIKRRQTLTKKLNSKESKKKTLEGCKNTYCNIGCKGTMFESGSEVPKELYAKLKNKELAEAFKPLYETQRKNLFGKKTNVLNDNFYEKISPAMVKQMKKDGALSGCVNPGYVEAFMKNMLKR
jgi:hypothetical protein